MQYFTLCPFLTTWPISFVGLMGGLLTRLLTFQTTNGGVREAGRTTNLQTPQDMLNKPINVLANMVATITAARHQGTGPS